MLYQQQATSSLDPQQAIAKQSQAKPSQAKAIVMNSSNKLFNEANQQLTHTPTDNNPAVMKEALSTEVTPRLQEELSMGWALRGVVMHRKVASGKKSVFFCNVREDSPEAETKKK